MRISDGSSDVCSSDLYRSFLDVEHQNALALSGDAVALAQLRREGGELGVQLGRVIAAVPARARSLGHLLGSRLLAGHHLDRLLRTVAPQRHHSLAVGRVLRHRSEEHTSALQYQIRNTYADFCVR